MSSFAKASDLLRLAEMASARHLGIALQDIEEEFGVDRRTAQRMTKALEDCFPNVATRTDEQRRKFWTLRGQDARLMLSRGIRDSELAAIEIAIRRAARDGASNEEKALASLRDRLLASMPGPHARRAEADAEAVLEANGFASRPGPRVRTDPVILATIAEALKAPNMLTITYVGERDNAPRERLVEPYGLLLGIRRYLVAREKGGDGRFRHFRLDRVGAARLEPHSFQRDPAFDLDTHAARAFGSFHAEAEYGEVAWRFAPSAAPIAREFVFHPRQEMTDEPDGSLTVRFHASGWLEMAWHLYQWGDRVEVLEPEGLRALVAPHQRADFPALP
ncbi:helix-turn-helix transcriptional regulator [Rhodovulum euryhalinum]|uniref:Putative DNA-binding transcriptional regulator YafY n=1 Tax=Rhodovulum euryhalinum TaxID=35805 RepID=A0A4R2KFP1_9RHOB|nr:WYL domain-containing protein [Rhodovulum euryhalinum]TCO72403.1 putative DNA-binding transcriptional regulator YafY [Rhodovulum euryhalinum]